MLHDAFNQFSDAQAVTATALSANVLELGVTRNIGAGEEVNLTVLVTETVTSGGASTVTFTLETDDDAGLASPVVLATTVAIPKATLVAGFRAVDGVAVPAASYERFLALRYTVGGAALSTGKFSAWLHKGRFDTRVFASGRTNLAG